jgi:toxin-antitoxin system PIN domain toxin
MRAVDTNVLVYAHRAETAQHSKARDVLDGLVKSGEPWGLPWPCVYEFLRVTTHRRVFAPPTPTWVAWENILALMASPGCVLLAPTSRHAGNLASLLRDQTLRGNDLFDAHIAALVVEHGVRALITGDRRLRRFDGVTVENPFA